MTIARARALSKAAFVLGLVASLAAFEGAAEAKTKKHRSKKKKQATPALVEDALKDADAKEAAAQDAARKAARGEPSTVKVPPQGAPQEVTPSEKAPAAVASLEEAEANLDATTMEEDSEEAESSEADGSVEPAPSDAPVRRARPRKERLLEDELAATQAEFKAKIENRFKGPYALSVRDQLNEMVIVGNLIARGLETIDGASPDDASLIAAVPSHMPAYGSITSGFGMRRSPFTKRVVMHRGIDIAAKPGSPVYAAADGVVAYAGWKGPLGRVVAINHGYGIMTRYAHNSRLLVRTGDVVHRGDVISRVGSTGRSTGAHCHYEVRVNGKAVDPMRFMFDVPSFETVTPQSLVASADGNVPVPMGGEGEASDAPEVGKVAIKAYDAKAQLPVNLSIVGAFGIIATYFMALVGRARRYEDLEDRSDFR